MPQILSELEALLGQATAERAAAEDVERQARVALENTKAELAMSTARRAELVNALSDAQMTAEATAGRLGECRGQLGDAERERERLADAAAAGSDPAGRTLAKAADNVSCLAELVKAHQRRAQGAEEARVAAEAALQQHDAAEATRATVGIEQLLLAEAGRADGHLAVVAGGLVVMSELIARRRILRPRAAWQLELGALADCSRAARDAVTYHFGTASPEVSLAISNMPGRLAIKSLRAAVSRNIEAWRAGTKPAEQPAPQAAA